MIEQLIQNLVQFPTEENKQSYLQFVSEVEYSLLRQSETLPFKSQEYFDKRKEAFSYRRKCAMILINSWVATYGSIEDAPVSYADTLIIPFQQIKEPK